MKWDEETTDPTGWWVSEKLDGVRTLWAPKGGEGKEGAMLSRLGNPFMVPKEWMDSAWVLFSASAVISAL